MADLRQGVHAAIILPTVHGGGGVDDQSPVICLDLWPENYESGNYHKNHLISEDELANMVLEEVKKQSI